MSIDPFQALDVIEIMEDFLEMNRPPEHIRKDLDLGYRIDMDNQQVIIFEIRPAYKNPSEIRELDFAKATFVKSRDLWRIYWKRASGWYPYTPEEMKTLKDFVKEVEEDPLGCFKG
jgi:hypothetical protein